MIDLCEDLLMHSCNKEFYVATQEGKNKNSISKKVAF